MVRRSLLWLNQTTVTNDDFEEYKDSWDEWTDWDWDIVAIHHLVKLEAICPMVDTEFAQRVHLFPYREFKFPQKEEKL